ncbi:MAG: hypothetical protein ACI4J4_06815 [Ruminiclostridium sp.]
MKRFFKAFAAAITSAALVLSLSACSLSVGTKSENEEYRDVFIDAPESASYSDLQYVFKLEDYGKMNVWVDTTNGHKFELKQENSGFNILDKEGNAVLFCGCTSRENYETLVADLSEVKTVNGRDFFYRENGDGSLDLFSYMADCGLEAGLVMETKEGFDVFRLVAFRGTPTEGASSDIYAYKPKTVASEQTAPAESTAPKETETQATTEAPGTESAASETTAQQLSAEEILASLPSDYNRVNWGVKYPLSDSYPGIFISIAPYKLYEDYCLIYAITSIYNETVSLSANAYAKDKEGNVIGETFVYVPALARGMTYVNMIYCDEGTPDGSIRWDEFEILPKTYERVVAWEADLQATGDYNDGVLTAEYNLYSTEDVTMTPGDVTILLTDENGNITGLGIDYCSDEVKAGESCRRTVDIYQDSTILSYTKNILIFTSPTTKVEE